MKFPYLVSAHGFGYLPGPVIPVAITGPLCTRTIEMLVDSGSIETVLPRPIARVLGIESLGEQIEMAGLSGQLRGEVASAALRIRGERFTSRIIVADTEVPLLGHRELFERFRVTFDDSDLALYLSPHLAK